MSEFDDNSLREIAKDIYPNCPEWLAIVRLELSLPSLYNKTDFEDSPPPYDQNVRAILEDIRTRATPQKHDLKAKPINLGEVEGFHPREVFTYMLELGKSERIFNFDYIHEGRHRDQILGFHRNGIQSANVTETVNIEGKWWTLVCNFDIPISQDPNKQSSRFHIKAAKSKPLAVKGIYFTR